MTLAPGVFAAALVVAGLVVNFLLYLRRVPTWWFFAGDAIALAGAGVAAVDAVPSLRDHEWLTAGLDILVAALAAIFPLAWHRAIQTPAGGLRARVGHPLPALALFGEDGKAVELRTLLGAGGGLLVWYRGHH